MGMFAREKAVRLFPFLIKLVRTNRGCLGRNLLLYHISPGLSRVLGKIKNKKFFEKVLTKMVKYGIMVISGRLPA
jgi:hypothetical protein